MSLIIEWVKSYVGLFLAFTLVLYIIPTNEYRGYLRFFLELLLVLFCLRPLIKISHMDLQENWMQTYQAFYEEMEKREQEAREQSYLDMNYINEMLAHQEENQ